MRRIRAKDAAWISRQDEFFSRGRFATPISFFFFSFAFFALFVMPSNAASQPVPASASVQAPSSTQAADPYYPVAIQEKDSSAAAAIPTPADGKIRLVIRADDIGFCHGVNEALRRLLDAKIVTSYSVMVNTPWLDEAVEILRGHPEVSVGVHTAVNSEWREYRWGPVSPVDKVPSLVDSFGKFFPSRRLMMLHEPRVEEVAAEVRAQIDLARRKGLAISYIDHHMSGAVNTREMQEAFEQIAREYNLGISRYFGEREAKSVYSDPPEKKLAAAIRNMEALTTPGLYLLVTHTGTDGPEMAAMTDLNPGGLANMSRHRQAEADVFCSPEFRAAIERKGIELVGYKELAREIGVANMRRSYTAEPYDKVLHKARQPLPETEKTIYMFLRVDDIFMLESKVKPQEIEAFLGVAEKHGAHVTLCAIPKRLLQHPNENGEMARQLREFVRRGHQIAQHGYNHRCPFTGRTDFEFYAPDATGWTRERRIETILEGRRLLEAAIGKKVVSYIAPGGDREYMQDDEKELLRQGYVDVPRARSAAEGGGWSPAGYGVCMDAVEFTWGLTEENYRENMEGAKKHFLQAAAEGRREVAIKFHDHFTRAAWNNGVTIRWLDEFLDWLTSQQTAADVRFATFEEYYQLKNPEFSAAF